MGMGIPTSAGSSRMHLIVGFVTGIVGMLLLPEIFSSVAILLGAYAWKQDPERSTGLVILLFGIVSMLVGIYVTAYPRIYDFFSPS
jgi:membrane protein DedA with SNARE-associated domain